MNDRENAKKALNSLINKSRIHLYKPIQIAEILYKSRIEKNINLLNLEEYRTKSKKWRNEVTSLLLGRVCTSSAKFQDNLFDENAIPPRILNELGIENDRTNGAVEAYIYNHFIAKHFQLANALKYCTEATPDNFYVKNFIDSFWNEPGLKRSLDKVYEIIVYALFNTIMETLELKVQISVNKEKTGVLKEFEDFSKKVMCIDMNTHIASSSAKIYRVGVTNAADRGLDMYSNWGPVIQIKHLTLDEQITSDIVSSISSNQIVIVCKDAEKRMILSLLSQIGWKSKIQSIITENDLIIWYEKALRGTYSSVMGKKLLDILTEEISEEFPSVNSLPQIILDRHYELIHDDFWK